MKVPLSWLREYVDLPAVTAHEIAEKLTAAGLKLESVTSYGHDIKNVVVGEVISIETLEGFKKPIRHCQVEVGEAAPREIVCGATNFEAGDRVPVALPGAVLPGGFEIASRQDLRAAVRRHDLLGGGARRGRLVPPASSCCPRAPRSARTWSSCSACVTT
ncbi:hypothetical protein GCM10018952_42320 [Streptosporangium vulgare]